MLKFNSEGKRPFSLRQASCGVKGAVFVALAVLCAVAFTGCSKNNKAASAGKDTLQSQADSEEVHGINRIVCLSPSGAEILSAIGAGDKIVARTDFCNYPASLNSIPSVGGFSGETLSVETILSYTPDLVYGSTGMHEVIAAGLEAVGVDVYLSDAETIQGVLSEILYMGVLVDKFSEAEVVVNNMKTSLDETAKLFAGKENKPVVYYEVWCPPYMSAGGKSFINDIITCAGGENLFGSLNEAYPIVSEEAIIKGNPDLILLPDSNGISVEDVKQRNGWDKLTVVSQNHIYLINTDVFSRPGPRVVDGVKQLAELLYGSK